MSRSRKEVLADALRAEVGAASVDLKTLFTEDVVGWSPYVTVSGLTALADLAALREAAFSNVVITFRGLDEVGNKAFAEWLVEADHTGPLVLSEDSVLEATGTARPVARRHRGRLPRREDPVLPDVLRRHLADRADRRCLTSRPLRSSTSRTIRIRLDIDVLETQIRREASAAMGLGGEADLAIFVRDGWPGRRRHQRVDLGRLLRTAEPVGGAGSARARPRYAAPRRRRSRGGRARVLADRPLHLRLPGPGSV